MKKKAIVVLSGGQDSTTCLFMARRKHGAENVHAVTFDYGQRHAIEIESARKVARLAEVSHEVIALGPILEGTSPLISASALEQYADKDSLPGGIEKTFVPMRNQLFLTIAANRAYVMEAREVWTGVCEEDYGGYPDCRMNFIKSLEQSCNLGTFTGERGTVDNMTFQVPLMYMRKSQAVRAAWAMPECYAALAWTHTSYDGAYPPVGKDHATLLREKGFYEANLPDPLVLRALLAGLMEVPATSNYHTAICEDALERLESADWMEEL